MTINDLTGHYELQQPYGSLYYIYEAGTNTFGINEGDIEANQNLINNIKVTTDGEYLYFSDFCGITFYAQPDLEAMTVTIPVQYITTPTGYSFLQCLYDSRMFASGEDTPATFTEEDAQDIVLTITEDGDLSLWNSPTDKWDYIAHWGWNTNYGYIGGVFHKTSSFVPDEAVAPLIGTHTCTEFSGEWNSIWGDWDGTYSIWNNFDINTGEGIETIGVDPGTFDVTISSLGGLDVQVNGLWWGGLSIKGTYDPATKTFTFPLQSVWGGYTLCNSSICDVEVPTDSDVVPATAVVNDDNTITMNYTVEYSNYPYLFSSQTLKIVRGDIDGDGEVSISDISSMIDLIVGGTFTQAADLDGDGEITISDISALVDLILK